MPSLRKCLDSFFVALKHSNVKGEMSVLNVVIYLTVVHNFSLLIEIYIYFFNLKGVPGHIRFITDTRDSG